MPINADKPHLWKKDIEASVDQFNRWFMKFAPKTYRSARIETTKRVENTLEITKNLATLTAEILKGNPGILPTLRMCCCPSLARDRLIGLAGVGKSLVGTMEEGSLPVRLAPAIMDNALERIIGIITQMLDVDIFPWLSGQESPEESVRHRAATIVADRLCGAVSDPIVRNAQEKRQLTLIAKYLKSRGYIQKALSVGKPITEMEPGTFTFRMNVVVGTERKVNIPVDVVIQPKTVKESRLPILIEAKSAGDFTNVNKRRKEEATKVRQLHATYGQNLQFVLFLCGYFDAGYLGYEAAEGIDWVWEHRIEDLGQLGL